MDTPIVYALISLFIAGCTPSQDPIDHTRLNASQEVLAPVSESFQIVDAAFLDSHRRVKSEGSLYAGKLQGQLRLSLKSNDPGLVPRFSFDTHWSLHHSNNHQSVAFRHRYSGDIIDNGFEILIPLEAALAPGTYLLTVELRDDHRYEALGYTHELVIQRLGTEKSGSH